MGLGKTVEALALIASVREDTASYERREHQNQLPPKTQHTQHTRTTNLEMHTPPRSLLLMHWRCTTGKQAATEHVRSWNSIDSEEESTVLLDEEEEGIKDRRSASDTSAPSRSRSLEEYLAGTTGTAAIAPPFPPLSGGKIPCKATLVICPMSLVAQVRVLLQLLPWGVFCLPVLPVHMYCMVLAMLSSIAPRCFHPPRPLLALALADHGTGVCLSRCWLPAANWLWRGSPCGRSASAANDTHLSI